MNYTALTDLRKEITETYRFMRKNNSSISDFSLDFINDAAKQQFKRYVRHAYRFDEITEEQKQSLLSNL